MKNENPFPYSDDNKRYHTWNYYLRNRFGGKVAKVPLDAGFTCPNRDGTCGVGGCSFCTPAGSGDFVMRRAEALQAQYESGLAMMRRKWPDCRGIAYFQAYTNTHGSLARMKECFTPFIMRSDTAAVAIATRADCLEDEKIAWLADMNRHKEIWIELGLQTIHDETAARLNRGHTYAVFADCVRRLAQTDLHICVHLMNALPKETPQMMLASAEAVASLPVHAVKIHMLHLLKGTRLAQQYAQHPFPLQSMEEYVDTVVRQLELFPPSFIMQRLTGDGAAKELIAPQWTLRKVQVLNEIDKRMAALDTWQGRLWQKAF